MKKIWKKVLALTLCVLLAGMFAGCDMLDEMREDQAFSLGYGEVLWNGNIYKVLPENKYFNPIISGERSIVLTEEDVPVLLSDTIYLTYLGVSEDEVLLQSYASDGVYCRADQHQALAKRLSEPFVAEELCFQYSYYDFEKDEYVEGFHTLTPTQSHAVNEVLTTVTPWVLDESAVQLSGWSIIIQESSADHLMRKDRAELIVEGLSAYLVMEMGGESYVYTIPETLRPVFIEMINLYENVW